MECSKLYVYDHHAASNGTLNNGEDRVIGSIWMASTSKQMPAVRGAGIRA